MLELSVLMTVFVGGVVGKSVPVYFLNADYDYRNMKDWSRPDIDCVHTVGDTIPFPEKVTVCVRMMHITYENPVASSYATAFGFGTFLDDWSELDEGFLYGEWETGPWWGYRTKGKAPASYGWVGLGDSGGSDHGVWRHTCTVIDFTNGRTAVVENGVKFFDKKFEDLIPTYKSFEKKITTVTAGCVYKLGATPMMSLHGKVTDFQMWDKILSDEEMIKITNCEKFKSGNLLSWETGNWFLNSSQGTARMEMLDLQRDVCAPRTSSLHLIPYKLSFEPESLHMCTKFSGKIATYSKKEKFDQLTRFLSVKQHMNTGDCTKKIKDKDAVRFRTWVGLDDYEQEGIFQNWYTDELVEYTPWADARPYVGGTRYNCMMLQLHLEDSGTPTPRLYDVTVNDEECAVGFCNLCEIPAPVRTMVVRGLCELSMFDKVYNYVINEDGQSMYIGSRTSVLYYDKEKLQWVWYDRKSSKSVATSISSEASLLMGVHTVDFSGVIDDKCYTGGPNKEKKIKLTTCSYGEFTCNDGQCIDIEQRCDQTSNCLDESDEDECKMIFMKDNYNKKIAPFIFDKINNRNIPVNVNVSMSVIDIIKIEEVDHTFTLKFRLVLEWYDYRIKYWNLKKSRSANALAIEEVQKLWIPFLVFDNTENNEATKGTEDTELTLTREGDYIGSEDTVVEEINIFEGKFNRITFEQVFTKTFKCVYKLQLYPFDTQICRVNLIVRKLETAVMMVTPNMLFMESETVLTQYIIKNWTLAYNNMTDPNAGIRMELVLKRRIMNAVLTVYLPTLLILTIVYATNFFKDFFFEAVVTVNLTALLVLTTLFISVSGSLPLTAYVKMVDIWLIFAQVIPWIEVLLHTLTDMMRTEGEEGREINHHGKTITVGGAGGDSTDTLSTEDELENKQNSLHVTADDRPYTADYNKMTQRDEEQLVDARKQFYENAQVETDIVAKLQFIARYVIPGCLLAFSVIYWTYGLSYYFSDEF